jgi:acyl-coenzyme A synthetase/AMP-(fatty) acid ligase
VTEAEVRKFVDVQVAHYKRLAEIAFVDTIPKSASGKILRRVLAERERSSRALAAHAPPGAAASA